MSVLQSIFTNCRIQNYTVNNWKKKQVIISLVKAMFSGSVGLFVCKQHYLECYQQIAMTFYGGVKGGAMKHWWNCGGDLGFIRWVNEQKNIIVVLCSDRGAGNDPETSALAIYQGIR